LRNGTKRDNIGYLHQPVLWAENICLLPITLLTVWRGSCSC